MWPRAPRASRDAARGANYTSPRPTSISRCCARRELHAMGMHADIARYEPANSYGCTWSWCPASAGERGQPIRTDPARRQIALPARGEKIMTGVRVFRKTQTPGPGCLILGLHRPEVCASSPEDESDDEGMARVSPCQKAKPVKACAFPGGLGDWYLWVVLCQKRHLFGLPVDPVAGIAFPGFPGAPSPFTNGMAEKRAKDRAPGKHLAMFAGALGAGAARGRPKAYQATPLPWPSFVSSLTPFSIHQINGGEKSH